MKEVLVSLVMMLMSSANATDSFMVENAVNSIANKAVDGF